MCVTPSRSALFIRAFCPPRPRASPEPALLRHQGRAPGASPPCPAAQTEEAGPGVSPRPAAPRGLRPQGGGAARGGGAGRGPRGEGGGARGGRCGRRSCLGLPRPRAGSEGSAGTRVSPKGDQRPSNPLSRRQLRAQVSEATGRMNPGGDGEVGAPWSGNSWRRGWRRPPPGQAWGRSWSPGFRGGREADPGTLRFDGEAEVGLL